VQHRNPSPKSNTGKPEGLPLDQRSPHVDRCVRT